VCTLSPLSQKRSPAWFDSSRVRLLTLLVACFHENIIFSFDFLRFSFNFPSIFLRSQNSENRNWSVFYLRKRLLALRASEFRLVDLGGRPSFLRQCCQHFFIFSGNPPKKNMKIKKNRRKIRKSKEIEGNRRKISEFRNFDFRTWTITIRCECTPHRISGCGGTAPQSDGRCEPKNHCSGPRISGEN